MEGWRNISLEELIDFAIGGDWGKDPLKTNDAEFEDVICIRGSEIRNWKDEKGKTSVVRKVKSANVEKRRLKDGDIVVEISGGGPEQPVGRTILIDKKAIEQAGSLPLICTNFLRLMRFKQGNDTAFIDWYLQFFYTTGEIAEYQGGSNNLRNLRFNDFLTIEVPLPPLPEQKRIVVKIEALFAQLDEGVEKLKQAQQQLKTYRQAVLKAAFEGELTKDFREVTELSGAVKLIEELRKSQPKRYKKAVARAQTESLRTPVKWKSYGNLLDDELGLVIELPESWSYIKVGEVADDVFDGPFGSHLKSKDYIDQGVRVIRLENIGPVEFRDHLKSYVSEEKYNSISNHKVVAGDIIFSSFISDDIRVVVLPEHIDLAINKSDCFCVRTDDETVNKWYLTYYLSSLSTRQQLIDHVHGATRPRINTTQLKQVLVPYCDIKEQKQIVQEIESRLSLADQLEQSIEQALKQSETLRQSILKKAFEGRLVEVVKEIGI